VSANTHELVMMGITAFVCLPIGYVAGRIIQRITDLKEMDERDEHVELHPDYAYRAKHVA
jgi:hypothetical protein